MTATYTIEPWDPGYGLAYSADAEAASTAELDLDLELPASLWQPVDPDLYGPVPKTLLFLDGVRRIDARVWVQGSVRPVPGIAASIAAGLVRCSDGCPAEIVGVVVERDLITAAPDATDLVTRAAAYKVQRARDGSLDELSLTLQQCLARVEATLASSTGSDPGLLVVDGPLRGRTHLTNAVGYIKTHHTTYLPDTHAAVVAALKPGQRSPAFTMGTSWRRHSWYLQLDRVDGVPWAGVVRLECSADLAAAQVTELADLTARVLPPLASTPHKDPRAPQNLVPIGGLERQLRHRLGDQQVLYRSLRAAARLWSMPAGWRSAVAWPDDAVLVGEDGDLGAVTQAESGEDAGDVAFDGCLAEVEAGGDLGVGQPRRDKPDYVALPLAQAARGASGRGGGGRAAAEVFDQAAGDGRGEQRLAGADRADGAGQLLAGGVLEQEAAGSGLHGVVDVLVEVEGGQHEDLGPAAASGKLGGCLDAVESGHADVHQDDVRVQAACLCECLAAVAGFARDAEIWFGFHQHAQALADQVLVVGDQHADHGGSPIGSQAQTVNPPPGRGPARRSPPNSATRSRMPVNPCPPASP